MVGRHSIRLAGRALLWALGLMALGLALTPGQAANILVPTTRLDDVGPLRVSPNQLKPDECGGIPLTNIVVASGGTATGTNGNDLILGTAGSNWLEGLGGDDCIVAGAGLDVLWGDDGDDVLIGGPGLDLCFGGPGFDLLYGCELALQRARGRRGPGNLNTLPPGWRGRVQQRLGVPTPTPTPLTPTPGP